MQEILELCNDSNGWKPVIRRTGSIPLWCRSELAHHLAKIAQQTAGAIVSRRFVAELSEPAPHAHPVEERLEPQCSLRFRVIYRSISFEQRLVTPRVFMRRAEQGFRQVEQTVGGACITEIDKAAQSKPTVVEAAKRQHIALMEVIMAEHRA